MTTQIVNLILDKFVEHYTKYMQTDLADDSPLRASIVKKGLLQTGKIENSFQIGISGGDHDNPDDQDGIITISKIPDIGVKLPAREIGGGQFWMRRGVIRMECFFIAEGLDEDEAHEVAYNRLGRAMELVELTPTAGLVDSFGESAGSPYCYANSFFEAGGPPSSYIFRGKILWAVFTERP